MVSPIKLLPLYGDHRKLKIGLLGGSFNPAHEGHIYISAEAKKSMNLEEVWWIIAQQNPLKSSQDLAPFEVRYSYTQAICPSWIRILCLERNRSYSYTMDTIQILKKRFPHVQFLWLMGTDQGQTLPLWYKINDLKKIIPFLFLSRDTRYLPPYAFFKQDARNYVPLCELLEHPLPAWSMKKILPCAMSSTKIRKKYIAPWYG